MAKKEIKRIGVLTSGGDAPGMNAAVRAVTRTALAHNLEVVGIMNGYKGLLDDKMVNLSERDVSYIINRGGTMLYTARSERFKTAEGVKQAADMCRAKNIDGIVAIGGDGTFRGANDLAEEGIPCVGVPGTIDNDIAATDVTIGFDTAMNTVVELIDKIRDTGESHSRCNVIEVMGREAGDIALQTALSVGAIAAIVKENPFDIDAMIAKMKIARLNGKRNFIIIICEGMGKDYGPNLVARIEEETGIETRLSILGYIQRGGSPTLRDRVLATQMGAAAVNSLLMGDTNDIICARGNDIVSMEMSYSVTLDNLYKGKLSPEQVKKISPSMLFEMNKHIASKKGYKEYISHLIESVSL
ncbi:MAG: 6-phosphofructokinase [Clostridia bacterium]|nr:6-phosphofructokinase [Clostridia bacterium]